MPDIVISIEGGLIHEVIADGDAKIYGVRVLVIDHDTEGGDPENIKLVPQTTGKEEECYVQEQEITYDSDRVRSLYELVDKE